MLIPKSQSGAAAEAGGLQTTTEELEDVRALGAAMAKPARHMIPFEVTSAVLDGASPLGDAAAIDVSCLTELKCGARKATRAEVQKLARALATQVDDLCDPPGP